MARCWIAVVLPLIILFIGCGEKTGRMAHAEDPQGRYRAQIAAARQVLEQQEPWADRAEWEVEKFGTGWKVTAWRIEHPDRKGPERYVPWGYSVIELDSRMVPVNYRRRK